MFWKAKSKSFKSREVTLVEKFIRMAIVTVKIE